MKRPQLTTLPIAAALIVAACGTPATGDLDASTADARAPASADAGPSADAPPQPDARPRLDGAPPVDAAPPADAAPPGLRVFVTSLAYYPDLRTAGGGATGREGADNICQRHADGAALGGAWRAWLSTSDLDAIDHIGGDGPWYGMDGGLLFPNRATLGLTPVEGIVLDETGAIPTDAMFDEAWTGTALGGRMVPLGEHATTTCWDWTSDEDHPSVVGRTGKLGDDGREWTDFVSPECWLVWPLYLYCFEQ